MKWVTMTAPKETKTSGRTQELVLELKSIRMNQEFVTQSVTIRVTLLYQFLREFYPHQ